MKRLAVWFALVLLLVGGIFLTSVGVSQAADSSIEPTTVTVDPALKHLKLTPDQTTASYDINIGNPTKQKISITVSGADFKSLNQSGGVAFLGTTPDTATNKHALVPWMTLPVKEFELNPGQSRRVPVILERLHELIPGGHYGAVLFRVNTVNELSESNKVQLNQVVSSLLFVTTHSGGIQSVELLKPNLRNFYLKLPDNLNLFFRANGNTQTAPRGVLTLKDPSGKTVKEAAINTNSGLVLPDSIRLFQTDLRPVNDSYLRPGKYTLTIAYRADNTRQFTTANYTFYYAPTAVIVAAGLVAGLLLVCIVLVVLLIQKKSKKKPAARSTQTRQIKSPKSVRKIDIT